MNVSIAICTYNGEKYLAEQLDSVINQTYAVSEILISDDASTDSTLQILRSYQERDNRIRIIENKENLGYIRNFELVLKQCREEYIAIGDQDDIWRSDKIEKLVAAYKRQPESSIVYCNSVLFTDVPDLDATNIGSFKHFEGAGDARPLVFRNTVSGHAMLFRKSFLSSVLPFDEQLFYDWSMAVTACYRDGLSFVPDVLVYQRRHAGNISVSAPGSTSASERKNHKELVMTHARKFASFDKVPKAHARWMLSLADVLQRNLQKQERMPLFLFLMRHRSIVYHYKRRKFGFFSHLKHSLKYSKTSA